MLERRFAFDDVAELYAQARPSYPAALVDDLVAAAGLSSSARLLELGSGPGNATTLFAQRGYTLVCLEPGAGLCAYARARFSDAKVEVVQTTFESWPLESSSFDLVFAAQSFHWIDPTIRFAKACAALRPGGTLAVFANRPERGSTPLDRAISETYARHAPDIKGRAGATDTHANLVATFAASNLFEPAVSRDYAWQQSYSSADYLALVDTHSDHRVLPEPTRARLRGAVGDAIDAHGGRYTVHYVSVLVHARPRL